MRADYTLARLYVSSDLSDNSQIILPKDQSHYLSTVLRKSVGDEVRVFNGREGEWRARIVQASKKSVTLEAVEQLRERPDMPDIWVLCAPIKRARTEFILEKATELGVSQIHPVITQRTQFPKMRLDRARAQIIEAAEQTERLDIPSIAEPMKLMDVMGQWDGARTLIFADEAGDCDSASKVLGGLSGPCAILIGPEGGFNDQERSYLRSLDFVKTVSLGPRILRADTAAVSLLTLWQSSCGDW